MAIVLPQSISPEQIRVLQEFRRLNAETLAIDVIRAIKHPSGVTGEAPAIGLVTSGYLEADASRENFSLTQRAKDFLAIDAKPDA